MHPILVVPDSLRPILAELERIEPLFHSAHAHATTAHYEALVAPEFWEIGASGRRYSRDYALGALRDRVRPPAEAAWVTRDYHVSAVAENLYLLTYTLVQPGRTTLRSTLWRRTSSGWQAVFHQGTVVG